MAAVLCKIDRQNCQPLAKVVMQFPREATALVLLRADEPSAEFAALLVGGGCAPLSEPELLQPPAPAPGKR